MYAIKYEYCDNIIEEFNNEPDEFKNWLKNHNRVDDEKVKNKLIEYCHTAWDIYIYRSSLYLHSYQIRN
jgi:hypothetical protein